MSRWQRDGLVVQWIDGGLHLSAGGDGLLLDTPVHAATQLDAAALGGLRTVALSSGRAHSVRGLVALLCAMEPHRSPTVPLRLRFLAGEERGPMLAEAWTRGWGRYAVSIDVEQPGAVFDVGAMTVRTFALAGGEPYWGPRPGVDRITTLGFRVNVGDTVVAYAPAAAPTNAVRRLLDGAALAVVEVGAAPWPRSAHRWRLNLSEALMASSTAQDVWVVTDEGQFAGDEA